MVRTHTCCSPVTRRSTRARQAQAAPGAHVGQSAPKNPSKRATRLATGPRSAWAARWQVGREHYLSRNITKRHDLEIFASHLRDKVHLKKITAWSLAYINETKTSTNFLSHKFPCPRGKIPCPGVEEIRGKITQLGIRPFFLRRLGPCITKEELKSIYQKTSP